MAVFYPYDGDGESGPDPLPCVRPVRDSTGCLVSTIIKEVLSMNWKDIATTVLIVMFGIYALKWLNKNYRVPVIGNIIEEV